MARIYSISVSNAVDGVSSGCQACALSTQPFGSTCVPCPPGHYIDTSTSQCTECPHNTYLVPRTTPGPDVCKPCGPASRSDKVCWPSFLCSSVTCLFFWNITVYTLCVPQDHSLCYSDCHFTHTDGNVTMTFDFSLLGSVGSLMNGPSFTSKGTKYFHQFSISLCGGQVWRNENLHTHFVYYFVSTRADPVIWSLSLFSWQCAQTMSQTYPSPTPREREAREPTLSRPSSVNQQ